MRIENLIVGAFQVNCWIVSNDSDHVIVFDPGAEPDRIISYLEKRHANVAAYMITHGHIDHISALAELWKKYRAPIGMHEADASWAFSSSNSMLPFYDALPVNLPVERLLEDGQEWNDAGLQYRVLTTPGHSPGGVCFFFPEQMTLITGDTLFAGSVGRTDLPRGNTRTLSSSLRRIRDLPGEASVYPGHGPSTTVKKELATNFFLQSSGLETETEGNLRNE